VPGEQRKLFLLIYNPTPAALQLDTGYLSAQGIQLLFAETKKETLEAMKKNEVAAVLTMHQPHNNHAVLFLRYIMQQYPTTQRILIAEVLDKEMIALAVNKAHINYLLFLPVEKEELHTLITKSFKRYLALSHPFRKINELMEYVHKFRKEAQTDTLTQLLNRRSFMSILKRAVELYQSHHISFSLVMLDLDHFKILNDTYGHMAGDRVLRQFSEILRRNTRSEDSVFRYGGEEFAIITQMDSAEKIKVFIERILNETRETSIPYDKQQIKFTFSGGIATVQPDITRSGLIKRADATLYAAKRQGRNRILIFEPAMLTDFKNPPQ
jgi:diguanylate cyclase (GGDEF)-like protein